PWLGISYRMDFSLYLLELNHALQLFYLDEVNRQFYFRRLPHHNDYSWRELALRLRHQSQLERALGYTFSAWISRLQDLLHANLLLLLSLLLKQSITTLQINRHIFLIIPVY